MSKINSFNLRETKGLTDVPEDLDTTISDREIANFRKYGKGNNDPWVSKLGRKLKLAAKQTLEPDDRDIFMHWYVHGVSETELYQKLRINGAYAIRLLAICNRISEASEQDVTTISCILSSFRSYNKK